MTGRRELQLAVGLCLLGSALVLLAVSRSWVTVEDGAGLTISSVRGSVDGGEVAGGAQALGYVGLAGVVALAATRRLGRVLVGVLVAAAGVGVVVDVAQALSDGLGSRGVGAGQVVAGTSPGWAWTAVVGGLLLVLSGLLVAVRGRRWAALSSAYEAPAGRPDAPPVTDKGVWDALDRGDDPTA